MLRTLILLALVVLGSGSFAEAGVTIHYEGMATSPDAVTKILGAVTAAAKKNQWKVEDASAKHGRLERVIDEKEKDYDGRVAGIVVHISDTCEPLHFQFGDDLFMQDYVKTQFAGAAIHIQIVELFESLRPHFKKLVINDEGEFWDTRDRAVLEGHIRQIDSMLVEIKRKDPKAKGPIRTKSGRMIDVIQ